MFQKGNGRSKRKKLHDATCASWSFVAHWRNRRYCGFYLNCDSDFIKSGFSIPESSNYPNRLEPKWSWPKLSTAAWEVHFRPSCVSQLGPRSPRARTVDLLLWTCCRLWTSKNRPKTPSWPFYSGKFEARPIWINNLSRLASNSGDPSENDFFNYPEPEIEHIRKR